MSGGRLPGGLVCAPPELTDRRDHVRRRSLVVLEPERGEFRRRKQQERLGGGGDALPGEQPGVAVRVGDVPGADQTQRRTDGVQPRRHDDLNTRDADGKSTNFQQFFWPK